MTAEIAIFNKTAIALAADSAATIISNGIHKKIYNGSEKLFTLSKHHPVGVMIYGNSDICGAPWELVIKTFRKQNALKSYASLHDWAEAFFTFISTNKSIITDQMRENSLMNFHFNDIMPSVMEDIDKIAQQESVNLARVVTLSEYHDIVLNYLDGFIQILGNCPYFQELDDNDTIFSITIINNYLDNICDNFITHDNSGVPDNIKNKILEILSLTSTKKAPVGVTSGIVIAGFGDDDYYPTILAFDVFGCLGAKVRTIFNIAKSSISSDANVIPYAQEQEVQLFLQGCYDELLRHSQVSYEKCFNEAIDQVKELINDNVDPALASQILNEIDLKTAGAVPAVASNINAFINMNYNQRVMSMLSFLPKQELAYMAESLVNLTAFKRKVSDQHETVGGPIDVALISKTDGFVWVKRKLYFQAELNHHFFSR